MAENSSQLTFADLKAMVEERLEETIRLEFKRELPDTGKNDDLARMIASMANSDGGIIVYGIEEDGDGRASVLLPFDVSKATERVILVARSVLDEPLSLSSVYSIEDETNPERGYLVVDIPKSERAPHLIDGRAWGRTAKTTVGLSRRQMGELFARSPGFAQEFGLVVGKPGRIYVKAVSEAYQESGPFNPNEIRTRHDHFLFFENDGDTDALDVSWEFVADPGKEENMPEVREDSFPLEVMPAGAQVRVRVFIPFDRQSTSVRTRWRDLAGNLHERIWPTTW